MRIRVARMGEEMIDMNPDSVADDTITSQNTKFPEIFGDLGTAWRILPFPGFAEGAGRLR